MPLGRCCFQSAPRRGGCPHPSGRARPRPISAKGKPPRNSVGKTLASFARPPGRGRPGLRGLRLTELPEEPLRRGVLVRRRQASISMRVGARLAGTEFALFAGLGAAGGTPNRQRLRLRRFHDSIMTRRPRAGWSFLTKNIHRELNFRQTLNTGETWIHGHMIAKESRPTREQR